MKQDGQGDEKLQIPIKRARARRTKGKDDKIAQGLMMAIEETIKKGLNFNNEGLEDDGNPPKKEYSTWIQEILRLARGWLEDREYSSPIEGKRSLGSLTEGFRSLHNKIHIIWYQSSLQRTSVIPGSNLDPVKIIMQELQSKQREMGYVRREITNLSIEQRGQSHIEGHVNSHSQKGYGNYNRHDGGRHTTPRGRRRGGPGGKAYNRTQEEVSRHEEWNEDNSNILSKPQVSTFKGWPKMEEKPKVAFKYNSKPKMEEKSRFITNPTRCFKCNGLGYSYQLSYQEDFYLS
ncbi:hypothetical protein M9H77_30917 [Catharanthus roseus]|uniref:Uncharacterized protein n=1 Tax=Catharanthus roseus TaxID=4058 RepID=A0ACB9ZZN9_CATRO|nr:hypothetical protein M9H77_30917 [Catharanthus roseus]